MSTPGSSDLESRAPAARTLGGSTAHAGAMRGAGRPAPDAHPMPTVTHSDLDVFLHAIRTGGESAAMEVAQTLLDRGVPAERLFLDLLAPAAVRFDELWNNDECDFLDVTVGLGRIQRVLRSMSRIFLDEAPPLEQNGAILLTNLPGHQHTLGLFMVAEFFVRAGWQVSMGWPVSHFDLQTAVRADWFDVLGFSVSTHEELPRLASEIKSARRHSRNPRVKVLVGGRIFVEHPALVARVGADAGTADAKEGPQVATRLLLGGAST